MIKLTLKCRDFIPPHYNSLLIALAVLPSQASHATKLKRELDFLHHSYVMSILNLKIQLLLLSLISPAESVTILLEVSGAISEGKHLPEQYYKLLPAASCCSDGVSAAGS